MKKILYLILLCMSANLHAQYFQRYFNEVVTAPPKRTEAFNDGLKSRANFGGGLPTRYYFAGTGFSELSPPTPTGTDARLRFVRTVAGGAVGVNNGYQFGDVAPMWFESRGRGICEVENGAGTGGYVVVGDLNNNAATGAGTIPGNTDMFFGIFSNAGTPTLRERIDVGRGADVATKVIRSKFMPGTYLICGYSVKGNYTDAVVARISGTGAVIWLRSLDMSAGTACHTTSKSIAANLCEDPTSGNIYVCGWVSGHKTNGDADGLVFALSGTGTPLWQVYHDLAGATDEYHDIKFTSGHNILLCGFSNVTAQNSGPFNDVWLSLFDPTKMPGPSGLLWTFKHRFSSPMQQTKGYRIIEGKNTVGAGVRYYVAGPVYPAAGGSPNQMMLEVFGSGLGGGTFHTYPPPYGPLGFDDRFGLDSVEMNMPSPGLIIFSSTVKQLTGGQSDSYLLKTYYNGAACNNFCNSFQDLLISVYPYAEMQVCKDTVYGVKKLKYVTYRYDSATICSQKKITCGSNNTPLTEDVQKAISFNSNEMELSPNPASNLLNVTVTSGKVGSYNAEVVDMSGRVFLSTAVQLRSESSSVNVNVATLRRGYYTLKLTGNGKIWTKQFMKE